MVTKTAFKISKRGNLRKVVIHSTVFIFLTIIFSRSVLGASYGTIDNPLGDNTSSLSSFFDKIVSVAIELGTIVSVLGIMYGGFQYVSAQGDEEKLGKARNTITWALVGTAVLLGARTIMSVVNDTVKQLQ